MRILKVQAFAVGMLIFMSAHAPVAHAQEEINWVSFEEAVAMAKKEPKKIIIDLYTDWCGWCKKMDRDTYARSEIVTYINENFYPVKFNAEQKEDVSFNGHTLKFIDNGRRGYHELAAALTRNQLSYPTTVFMDENLAVLQPISGYLDAKTFDTIARFFGEGRYKDTSWEDYQKEYKSPL